jgi:hypothetical protein
MITLTGCASAQEAGEYHFHGVERIVAIGDIHGNWDGYVATLRAAELIDDENNWTGGRTHFVQTGDIPDRGPDTLRVIRHMQQLKRQARRAGGQVHHLIGNHEAMNVYGDLRYVDPEEFAAFADQDSERLRERYLDTLLDRMASQDPKAFAALPEDFRARWLAAHPLGWLEHRYAWSPLWNENAEIYQWVADSPIAVKINDVLFVHGGISPAYCSQSLASLTQQAHMALKGRTDEELGILIDPKGPLWYRGFSAGESEASPAIVEAVLDRYDVEHIVVGHTPTGGFINPRHGARIIQIDVGIGQAYGGYVGYLDISPDGLHAGYTDGRVPLPETVDGLANYARAVADLHPDRVALLSALSELTLSASRPASKQSAGENSQARISCDIAP